MRKNLSMSCALSFIFCLSAKSLIAQEFVFRTNVENLRLREQPNIESKVIKAVTKGTLLYWSAVRSEKKVITDWKNSKVADYWYQVQFKDLSKDSVAWVFGKGLIFEGLLTIDSIQNIDNEWIRVEKSNQFSFNKIPITKVNWKPNKNFDSNVLNDFTLKFGNGTSKVFKNEKNNDGYGVQYIGEITDLGYYFIDYLRPCSDFSNIIEKKSGKVLDIEMIKFHEDKSCFDKGAMPIFSKDKKTGIFLFEGHGDGPYGFGFYDFQNHKIGKFFHWYYQGVSNFCFITNRSGIAKLKNDTYWKITIK